MQSLHVAPAIIERVLNHVEPSKLVRACQTCDYAAEKRDAWNRLGKRIAELPPHRRGSAADAVNLFQSRERL